MFKVSAWLTTDITEHAQLTSEFDSLEQAIHTVNSMMRGHILAILDENYSFTSAEGFTAMLEEHEMKEVDKDFYVDNNGKICMSMKYKITGAFIDIVQQ